MATFEQKTEQITNETVIAELYKLIGKNFPVVVSVSAGKVIQFSFEDEWQEGGTTPVLNDEGQVVEYKANYKTKKLTSAEVEKLKAWASKNMEA